MPTMSGLLLPFGTETADELFERRGSVTPFPDATGVISNRDYFQLHLCLP